MEEKEITSKPLSISVTYLLVILFMIHQRHTATGKEFDIVLPMTLEYVLTQAKSSKDSSKVLNGQQK